MTDWSLFTLSPGATLPTAISIEVPDGMQVDNVSVAVQLSTALGTELAMPTLNPEYPGGIDLSWKGDGHTWAGSAYLGSLSSPVTMDQVFGIESVETADVMSITAQVDYQCESGPGTVGLSYSIGLHAKSPEQVEIIEGEPTDTVAPHLSHQ
jgi:hypothetical protein